LASRTSKESRITLSALALDDLDRLMKMVSTNEIEEIEIESKELKVRIRGKSAGASAAPAAPQVFAFPSASLPMPAASVAPVAAPAAASVTPAAPPARAEAAADPAAPSATAIEVKSPMVGTFYRAPAPDAPPYVEPGDRVTEESVLCIVEAMKLMNEIKAETSGIVTEILVENGQPVEFGQPLFRIEPSE